jgi:hypothetical protein
VVRLVQKSRAMMNRTFATLAMIVLGASACEKSGKDTQEKVDNAQEQAQVEITNAQVKADEKVAEARNDFDKTREDYRHTMQSNLDELDKHLSDLDAKTLKATGTKKVELSNKATTLRAQRDAFAADVRALDNATTATLDATKIRMDKEWSNIKSTSDKLVW